MLAIIDIILSTSKDVQLWSASLPIGSESIRIIELINRLSTSIFDFQKLNLLTALDEEDEPLELYVRSLSSKSTINTTVTVPAYFNIDIKFNFIGI